MLCVGIDMSNAAAVKKIAEQYPQVFASVGVHPLDLAPSDEDENGTGNGCGSK